MLPNKSADNAERSVLRQSISMRSEEKNFVIKMVAWSMLQKEKMLSFVKFDVFDKNTCTDAAYYPIFANKIF